MSEQRPETCIWANMAGKMRRGWGGVGGADWAWVVWIICRLTVHTKDAAAPCHRKVRILSHATAEACARPPSITTHWPSLALQRRTGKRSILFIFYFFCSAPECNFVGLAVLFKIRVKTSESLNDLFLKKIIKKKKRPSSSSAKWALKSVDIAKCGQGIMESRQRKGQTHFAPVTALLVQQSTFSQLELSYRESCSANLFFFESIPTI